MQKLWHIGIKKTLKLAYKFNIRKVFAVILPQIPKMLFSRNRLSSIIDKMIGFILEFKSAVRPNRSFGRNFNASNHSTNYKRNNLFRLS